MAHTIYHGRITEPLFEGREIVVRGESFVVPELPLGARRRLSPRLRWMFERFAAPAASGDPGFEELERLHELWFEGALMALRMNYPEMSAEVVADNFSLSQVRRCFEAAVGAAGAPEDERPRPTPAATSAAPATAPTSSPTGTRSTGS